MGSVEPGSAEGTVLERHLPELPLIDRVKIQAEVAVPIIKELERALGVEDAHRLVRDALRPEWAEHAQRLACEHGGSTAALMAHSEDSAKGEPLTIEWHELRDDCARLDVTRCDYARFFQDLGEPGIGHILVCENDDWFVEGLGDVTLERHHTMMEGAERCDFCYRKAPT